MVSPTLVAFSIVVVGLSYAYHRFMKRISPTIPYAGSPSANRDPTFSERLAAAGEFGKDPVSFLCKTRGIIGNVFCVDLLVTKIVFLLGPEGNRELFKAPEEKLSFYDAIKWAFGPTMRHMYVPGFQENAGALKNMLFKQEQLDECYTMWLDLVESHFEEWAQQDAVPLFDNMSHLLISMMLVLLMGEEAYRRYRARLVPRMAKFERDIQQPILRALPPSLWRLSKHGRALFKSVDVFDEAAMEEMRDIMSHPEKHAARTDYLHAMVSQFGDRFAPAYGANIMAGVFAGRANVAMSIPWMFLHARRVPEVLEKIREEATLPRETRKPYLEATLRETARLYTNTITQRMTAQSTLVAGHVVPAGTLVAISPLATQRIEAEDGGVYENAGRWDPTRFLATVKDEGTGQEVSAYSRWFQRAEFVQFGLGQHACPGEKMARMIIFDIVFKVWMEKYDVEVVSGLQEGEKGIDGVGVDATWSEENFGTPGPRGGDVIVSVRKRNE